MLIVSVITIFLLESFIQHSIQLVEIDSKFTWRIQLTSKSYNIRYFYVCFSEPRHWNRCSEVSSWDPTIPWFPILIVLLWTIHFSISKHAEKVESIRRIRKKFDFISWDNWCSLLFSSYKLYHFDCLFSAIADKFVHIYVWNKNQTSARYFFQFFSIFRDEISFRYALVIALNFFTHQTKAYK